MRSIKAGMSKAKPRKKMNAPRIPSTTKKLIFGLPNADIGPFVIGY